MSEKSQILSELRGSKREVVVELLARMLIRKRQIKKREDALRKV